MTLHQAHIPNSTIKIIGRWGSDAFLIYLQGQVATLTKGGLQGHGGGTLVHTSGDQLLKPTRTYSPVSTNNPSFFLFRF